MLFWIVTQSFLLNVGEERLRDEQKEGLRGRLLDSRPRSLPRSNARARFSLPISRSNACDNNRTDRPVLFLPYDMRLSFAKLEVHTKSAFAEKHIQKIRQLYPTREDKNIKTAFIKMYTT